MQRYLTSKEIERWNNFLEKSFDYRISKYRISNILDGHSPVPKLIKETYDGSIVSDFDIEFKYQFSVVKSKSELLWKIISSNLKNEIAISTNFEIHNLNLKIDQNIKSIIDNRTETGHTLYGIEMVRVELRIDKMYSVIKLVTAIEDSIEMFSLLYGVDEDGKEIFIPKYKIGDIVSPDGKLWITKDSEYMIIDYKVDLKMNGDKVEYDLLYKVAKMNTTNLRSLIIKFDYEEKLVNEESIKPSRDNNINIILN
jgi:hypothetical protein